MSYACRMHAFMHAARRACAYAYANANANADADADADADAPHRAVRMHAKPCHASSYVSK